MFLRPRLSRLALKYLLGFGALAAVAAPVVTNPTPPAHAQTVIAKTCAPCHQGAKAPAGLDLKTLDFKLDDANTFNWWVRIHDAVDKGVMPPGGKAAMSDEARAEFVRSVAQPMVAHERRRAAEQGRAVLRRLNRYEYENTVRTVLSAPWLILRDSLPEDGISSRFNKVGQALDVSHVQMSRYLETAETAIRLALDATGVPSTTRRIYARDQKKMIARMKYTAFNSHPERASIPILGFDAQPDVIAEKAPMTVGDKDPKTRELEGFATTASTYIGNEYHWDGFTAPAGGRYKIRMNVFSIWAETVYVNAPSNKALKAWRPSRQKTSKGRTVEPVSLYAIRAGDKRLLGTYDVNAEPTVHEIEVDLLPGEQILPDAARLFRSRPGWLGNPEASEAGTPGVAYRWMEVEGPLVTPASRDSYARLFGKLEARRDPSSGRLLAVHGTEADAEPLLRAFVRQAYNRPAPEEDVPQFLGIIRDRLRSGSKKEPFLDAMVAGYTAVLCSPGFLYLQERPGPLDSYALASRLSYFLWNGPPDARLRKLAQDGALATPAALRTETKRLLDDPRSRDFVNAFLDYWIDLRKLGDNTPDQTLYPESYLDDLLMESARNETQIYFDRLIRENRPASEIIDSREAVLNSHLARHYGLPPVAGIDMRVVPLPEGSVRGGLLTQASVLTITANGTTTSPVLRGVWLMERILGDPPPPPPPGVPAVEPDTRGATTIRQQLDKHRAVPSCASCHVKIDPPGFALENFDVVGGWRDRYRSTEEGTPVQGFGKNGWAFTYKLGQPVDAAGKMATGESFHDIREFKQLLLKNQPQVARNMVKQFVTYATGAAPGFADRAEVDRIVAASAKDGYRMRTLITQIVESSLFRNK